MIYAVIRNHNGHQEDKLNRLRFCVSTLGGFQAEVSESLLFWRAMVSNACRPQFALSFLEIMPRSIVIVFDCLPAHWLGCYGNFDVVTPAFDWLATQSVLFDRCFANSPTANNSQALVNGWHTSTDSDDSAFALADPPTEPEDVAAKLANAESGPVWLWMPETQGVLPAEKDREDTDEKSSEDDEPDEPAEHVVEQCDEMLVEVLEQIEAAGWSDALLIVTAKRGVALSEILPDDNPVAKGQLLVSKGPDSSNLRLPLLIRHPTVQSFRSQSIVQSVDVLPTLQEWAGVGQNSGEDSNAVGLSLLPLVAGDCDEVRKHGFFRDESYLGIVSSDFLLMRPRDDSHEPQLFRQPGDRWLVHDVAVEYPDVVDELTAVLNGWQS